MSGNRQRRQLISTASASSSTATVSTSMVRPGPSSVSTATSSSSARKRKTTTTTIPLPPRVYLPSHGMFGSIPDSKEAREPSLLCPICFEYLKEPHMTSCGHTFCYICIMNAIAQSNRCPRCSKQIPNEVYPNLVISEVITNKKKKEQEIKTKKAKGCSKVEEKLQSVLDDDDVTTEDLDSIIHTLTLKREKTYNQSYVAQQDLTRSFLTQLKSQKRIELNQLEREFAVIEKDLEHSEKNIQNFNAKIQPYETISVKEGCSNPEGFNVQGSPKSKSVNAVVNEKLKLEREGRMHSHYNDLKDFYYTERIREITFPSQNEDWDYQRLDHFTKCLNQFTRFKGFRPLATLNYTADIFTPSSIVSSIEFSNDNEMFGIAGVTKRIKIYDFIATLKDVVDIHYPCSELTCNAKISSISWSHFEKNVLASSNYEGAVVLWDIGTEKKIKSFQEHEKRCWSVDFNRSNTKLFASGSDDARVKLWSTDTPHSISGLEAEANVCCVKFNPDSAHHLAFGSADHCVHYFDLRNTKVALDVFRGHEKAVSYVKFFDKDSLISASTDSQLKLWHVGDSTCKRTYHGHVNEKNFVGLATDNDFIICGSENNSLYAYYKGLSKPLFHFKFDPLKSVFDRGGDSNNDQTDQHEFISAVCWRNDTNTVIGANSQGLIKILELT